MIALTTEQAIAAADEPRVVALVLARVALVDHPDEGHASPDALSAVLTYCGITTTQEQARALLNAVRNYGDRCGCGEDECDRREVTNVQDRLDAALTSIVGAS